MNDYRITIVLPNRTEDKQDIAYIVSRILEKSDIDNFVTQTDTLDTEDIV